MTERGLKNIVFYSTFTNVFFCHVFTFFNVFLFFFLERFFLHLWLSVSNRQTEASDVVEQSVGKPYVSAVAQLREAVEAAASGR